MPVKSASSLKQTSNKPSNPGPSGFSRGECGGLICAAVGTVSGVLGGALGIVGSVLTLDPVGVILSAADIVGSLFGFLF